MIRRVGTKGSFAVGVMLLLAAATGCCISHSLGLRDPVPPRCPTAGLVSPHRQVYAGHAPCYGYYPTQWRPWPEWCTACPPPNSPAQVELRVIDEEATSPAGRVLAPDGRGPSVPTPSDEAYRPGTEIPPVSEGLQGFGETPPLEPSESSGKGPGTSPFQDEGRPPLERPAIVPAVDGASEDPDSQPDPAIENAGPEPPEGKLEENVEPGSPAPKADGEPETPPQPPAPTNLDSLPEPDTVPIHINSGSRSKRIGPPANDDARSLPDPVSVRHVVIPEPNPAQYAMSIKDDSLPLKSRQLTRCDGKEQYRPRRGLLAWLASAGRKVQKSLTE